MAVPLYPYKERLPAPIYWLYRGLRTILTGLCFVEFWGGTVLVCWLWLPWLLLWPGTREQKQRRVLKTVGRGFRLFHWTMRKLRLYDRRTPYPVLRPPGVPADKPCILVANHPTLCDTTSIVSLFPNVVAVARPSLANHPLIKPIVRACGFIPLGIHIVKDCQDKLAMGFDVLVFPEGTRSPLGGLHPFHRGAFEVAARAKVPVVLLKLTCEPSVLSKRRPIWKMSDKKAMLTIEPFDVIDPGSASSRELCRAIEQRYRELLGYSQPEMPRERGTA